MAQLRKLRTRVPVSARSDRRPRKVATQTRQLDMPSAAVIAVAVLLILLTIYVPLKNYFQGEAEIARLEESIAAKEVKRDKLRDEIEMYQDDAFVEQEARRRLGVIRPGETAWRIIDPRLSPETQVTTSSTDESVQPKWYEVLWDSIAVPPTTTAVQ